MDAPTHIVGPHTRYTKHTAAAKAHSNPYVSVLSRSAAAAHTALLALHLPHARYNSSRAVGPLLCDSHGRRLCETGTGSTVDDLLYIAIGPSCKVLWSMISTHCHEMYDHVGDLVRVGGEHEVALQLQGLVPLADTVFVLRRLCRHQVPTDRYPQPPDTNKTDKTDETRRRADRKIKQAEKQAGRQTDRRCLTMPAYSARLPARGGGI